MQACTAVKLKKQIDPVRGGPATGATRGCAAESVGEVQEVEWGRGIAQPAQRRASMREVSDPKFTHFTD